MKLHWRILIAMVAGVVVGLALRIAPATLDPVVDIAATVGQGAGRIFLALLSMVVVPLVFTSLVSSMTALRGSTGLRRMGATTLAYYATTSLAAITTGIIMSNIIRPGAGVSYEAIMARARGADTALPTLEKAGSVWEVLGGIAFRMIPKNVIDAASNNRNMLAVIFFALLLGYFITRAEDDVASRLSRFFEDLYDVLLRMTHAIIELAPYGIFGYLVFVSINTDAQLVVALAKYMLTVFLGLMVHAVVTLPLLLWVLTRRNPITFFKSLWPALATAFSTASSSGTLPLTMTSVEQAGVDRPVSNFVLPLGATVNMDGTALYEAAAVLFIAQMLGDLSLSQQIVVAFTALLASVGAAGIPHAGTVMMVIVLDAVGLPKEAVLTILAVDRVLDMLRTAVNVWSDSNAAAVVHHFRGAAEPQTSALPTAEAG